MLFCWNGGIYSAKGHGVVEGDISIVEELISKEIAVDDDIFGEDDLIAETLDCGLAWLGSHTYFLPLEADSNLGETTFDDDGVIPDDFCFLFGVAVVEGGVSVGNHISDWVVDSQGYIVKKVDFLTEFGESSVQLIIFAEGDVVLEFEVGDVAVLVGLLCGDLCWVEGWGGDAEEHDRDTKGNYKGLWHWVFCSRIYMIINHLLYKSLLST